MKKSVSPLVVIIVLVVVVLVVGLLVWRLTGSREAKGAADRPAPEQVSPGMMPVPIPTDSQGAKGGSGGS